MGNHTDLIIITASICMLATIITAWFITAARLFRLKSFKRLFSGTNNLVKAHVDYAIMTALLAAVYLTYRQLALHPPLWVTVTLCAGSFLNPATFVITAVKPDINVSPGSWFFLLANTCFILTSVGYVMTALQFIKAIV